MMEKFKFLNENTHLDPIILRDEIIEIAFNFCSQYAAYVEKCRIEYLDENPQIDPSGRYAFPLPYHEIAVEIEEGKLWHGGSDYYEDEDKLIHSVYLDRNENSNLKDVIIDIVERDNGEFNIDKIQVDTSRQQEFF